MGRQQLMMLAVAVIAIAALVVALVAISRAHGGDTRRVVTVTRTVPGARRLPARRPRERRRSCKRRAVTGVRLDARTSHLRRRRAQGDGDPGPSAPSWSSPRRWSRRWGVVVSSTGNEHARTAARRRHDTHADVCGARGQRPLTVEGVDAQQFTAVLGGNGALHVSGRAADLDAILSGVGTADLAGLRAQRVHAVLSGAGRLTVAASSGLDAALSGTGSIVYTGSPASVKSVVTGAGTVTSG